MCGIVGGWLRETVPDHLHKAVAAIAHRGPDGQGEYVDPPTNGKRPASAALRDLDGYG